MAFASEANFTADHPSRKDKAADTYTRKISKFSRNRADLGNQLISETQASPCYEMLYRRLFRTFSINIMNNFSYTARGFHSASAVIDRSRKQQTAVAKGLRSILNLWSGISTGLSKIIARVQSNEAYTQYLYESVHFAKQNIFSPSTRCAVPRFYHELTKTVHKSPYKRNTSNLPVIAAVENSPFPVCCRR